MKQIILFYIEENSIKLQNSHKNPTVIHGRRKSNLYLLSKMNHASVQITLRSYNFSSVPKKDALFCAQFSK